MSSSDLATQAQAVARRLASLPEQKRQRVERTLILLSARDARTLELLRQLSGGDITVEELEKELGLAVNESGGSAVASAA